MSSAGARNAQSNPPCCSPVLLRQVSGADPGGHTLPPSEFPRKLADAQRMLKELRGRDFARNLRDAEAEKREAQLRKGVPPLLHPPILICLKSKVPSARPSPQNQAEGSSFRVCHVRAAWGERAAVHTPERMWKMTSHHQAERGLLRS